MVEKYTVRLENGVTEVTKRSRKDSQGRGESGNVWKYLGLVGDLGFRVALPIVGGALLGKYLDQRLESYPTYTISLLGAGIVIGMAGFFGAIREVIRSKS